MFGIPFVFLAGLTAPPCNRKDTTGASEYVVTMSLPTLLASIDTGCLDQVMKVMGAVLLAATPSNPFIVEELGPKIQPWSLSPLSPDYLMMYLDLWDFFVASAFGTGRVKRARVFARA